MLPLLIRTVNTATNASEVSPFNSSPVRIGRNELNDLVLREPFVSQWHAVIWFDEQGARYVDLGSTNGTMVNGQRAQKNIPVPLTEQVDLRIGPLQVQFTRAPMPGGIGQPQQPQRDSMFFVVPKNLTTTTDQGGAPMPEARTMIFNAMQGPPAVATAALEQDQHALEVQRYAQAAAQRLNPVYENYRRAWTQVFHEAQREIGGLPPNLKAEVLVALTERLPQLGREPDMRGMAKNLNISPAVLGEVDPEEFIRRLGGDAGQMEPALLMERVGALTEAFSQAYVELRKGYEQFGRDMAVKVTHESTPLHRAQSAKELLAYLLDGSADGAERVNELNRAFAELAIHQVAMLSGLLEGVRSLLSRLSPYEVTGQKLPAPNQIAKPPGTGLLDLLIPFRVYGFWGKYVSRHRSFVEEDRFTREVFGKAFARAYYMVTGGQYDAGGLTGPVSKHTTEI